jgi:predicted NUDIX family NTP pyrophosphohydrolase
MKKHSCGGILYTLYNNQIYIVLGMEKGAWFPFKGIREKTETNKQAAVREIYEETCGVVNVSNINLQCNFSTKRKHYHIGLAFISINEIKQFYINRNKLEYEIKNQKDIDYKWAYLEKTDLKIFKLDTIFKNKFHEVTYKPIKFYYNYLKKIQSSICQKKSGKITNCSYQVCDCCLTITNHHIKKVFHGQTF